MQNKHIEHPEDTILTGDLSVLDLLLTPGQLSTKIDGAPAIVWGTNPATGNFFVGTKSVFNKVKIKINESHAEIDQNHDGNVAEILHDCFDRLPHTTNVYQGDFIGVGGSDTYTPNTITYRFNEVVTEDIIVAPHTVYKVKTDLRDAEAFPLPSYALVSTPFCKFVDTRAHIFTGQYDKCAGDFGDLKEMIDFAKVMAQTVTFVSDKEAKDLKRQLNACIREQRPVANKDFDCDPNLLGLWALVKSIKEDALHLCRPQWQGNDCAAFIGDEQITAEGFVFSNAKGMVKLVNREVFSYNNFTRAKAWS